MVHSTFVQGHVMDGRDTSPLGIPKSPSFHSGLDLVASSPASGVNSSLVDFVVVNNYCEQKNNPFVVVEGATTNNNNAAAYSHNFTLTLRRESNGGGGGKSEGLLHCDGGVLLSRKNHEVERVVQMQGHLPRLAGIH